MGKYEDLLKKCEELKEKIRVLQARISTQDQKTVKEIQLKYLRGRLSEVGRRLSNLTMYEDNDD